MSLGRGQLFLECCRMSTFGKRHNEGYPYLEVSIPVDVPQILTVTELCGGEHLHIASIVTSVALHNTALSLHLASTSLAFTSPNSARGFSLLVNPLDFELCTSYVLVSLQYLRGVLLTCFESVTSFHLWMKSDQRQLHP